MTSSLPLMKRPKGNRGKAAATQEEALSGESAFNLLITETSRLFHRLKVVAEEVHHRGEMSGALRSVLRELDQRVAQTVPQMARERAVSRQHIQILVNQLVEEGQVELAPNPVHKRSALVRLTPRGKKFVDAMNRREAKLLGKTGAGVPDKKMREAAETLRALRSLFESDRWKRALKSHK